MKLVLNGKALFTKKRIGREFDNSIKTQQVTAVSRNCEFCGKFTFYNRKIEKCTISKPKVSFQPEYIKTKKGAQMQFKRSFNTI